MSDRYTTARDMAEDLHDFLKTTPSGPPVVAAASPRPEPGPDAPAPARPPAARIPTRPDQDRAQGASFVRRARRRLLPRAASRAAQPRWPAREHPLLEDADRDHRCGKDVSSRPDLRPFGLRQVFAREGGALAAAVWKHCLCDVEATADETEQRLLTRLKKACPALPDRAGLVESLAAVRKGRVLGAGRKLLVVIDQFEQWLHARRGDEDSELVAALRQCDGEHLQAIVLVRDDFWLAVSRFLADLEVELLQGHNTALVDLFDARHAAKVLTAFGAAFGNLPENAREITSDQTTSITAVIHRLEKAGFVRRA